MEYLSIFSTSSKSELDLYEVELDWSKDDIDVSEAGVSLKMSSENHQTYLQQSISIIDAGFSYVKNYEYR